MTDAEIEKIARLMGARIVGILPDVCHGATGAGLLGRFYQLRMQELRRQEQAQATPTAPGNAQGDSGFPSPAVLQTLTEEELVAALTEAEKAAEQLMSAVAKAKRLLGRLQGAGPKAQQGPDPSPASR